MRPFIRTVSRNAVLLAVAGLTLVLASARDTPAGEPPFRPLPAWLEGLVVGPGAEFRHLVVHGIYAPAPAGEAQGALPAAPPARNVAGAPPEATVLHGGPKAGRSRLAIRNLSPFPYAVWAGEVVRADDADYAVTERTILPADAETDVPVVRTSRTAPIAVPDPAARRAPAETWRGTIPGPALRFLVEDGAGERIVTAAADDLAREVELDTPRRSPPDLGSAQKISPRVIEYVTTLAAIPAGPSVARRKLIGYAALVDGGFAVIESCADEAAFREVWPDRLRGLAVEATLYEVENSLLTKDLEPSREPDRFLADVKAAILTVYGAETRVARLPGSHREISWRTDRDLGRALVHVPPAAPGPGGAAKAAPPVEDRAAILQFLLLRDPSQRRSAEEDEPDLDPGVLRRKFRRTAFEERWLDRRNGRVPPVGGGR